MSRRRRPPSPSQRIKALRREIRALELKNSELQARNEELTGIAFSAINLIRKPTLTNAEIDDLLGDDDPVDISHVSADKVPIKLKLLKVTNTRLRQQTEDPVGEGVREAMANGPGLTQSDWDDLLGSVETLAERIRTARKRGQTDLSDILPSLSERFRLPPELVETLFGGKEGE